MADTPARRVRADRYGDVVQAAAFRTARVRRAAGGGLVSVRVVRNTGASFGIGAGQPLLVAGSSAVVIAAVAVLRALVRSRAAALFLAVVLGGALGNLADRLFRPPGLGHGAVAAWIHVAGYPATLNLADVAVRAGAVGAAARRGPGHSCAAGRARDETRPGARGMGECALLSLRRSFPGDAGSRQRSQELLAGLAEGRWRPAAWGRFTGRGAVMSYEAAVQRPRAVAEVTALHAALLLLARGRGRAGGAWIGLSWLLAVTHLGLLGQRRSLGPANAVTLARGCLPALAVGRWTGPAVLAADVLDGQLARRRGEATVFGSYADTISDAAFWTWYAARHEPSRPLRAAAAAAWAAPAAVVAALSIARGQMTDVPRPALIRPAAPLAVWLVIRACSRRRGWPPAPVSGPRR